MKRFAFLFPGQGSQSVGMLDAWGDHPAVRHTLAEASDALGWDVERLIREGPKEQLDLTEHTQPVMLTTAVACFRAWIAETGMQPTLAAGHSLGEYSALVAAGSLSLIDALPLVQFRAQAMQDAVPVGDGAMAAVLGAPVGSVEMCCREAAARTGQVVEAANFNDPFQIVISGSLQAVSVACELLKEAGARRTVMLAVSAPFHCSLMRPAAERIRGRLASTSMKAPSIPVINNIDVRDESDPAVIRDALYRQSFGPVRWSETIEAIRKRDIDYFIECGPGKVLASMVRRIDADAQAGAVFDPTSLADTQALLS
jgi:[acyl-carrier-protein] S-malonyltransferase